MNLHHLGLGMEPNAQTAKEKIDTLTLSKFTTFLPSKEGYHQESGKMCVLYVCICIPALKLGSSVSFFWILNTCVNIWSLFFWLTSLCMTDVKSIYIKWPNFIPFHGWVIFHCTYVPQLHYAFICWWIFRLLPCPGYCKQHCNECWGTCVFLNYGCKILF